MEITKKRILDLGCGTSKVNGAIGVDRVALDGVDAVVDLAHTPYPFQPETFDEIYLNDIIEHLPDIIKVMEEIYRIIKPNGLVHIRVVNWNHRYASMDPTHLHYFTENSFDFFGKRKGRSYYTDIRFDVLDIEYIFDLKIKRIVRSKWILKFLSNYLCNILQGIKFTLGAVK